MSHGFSPGADLGRRTARAALEVYRPGRPAGWLRGARPARWDALWEGPVVVRTVAVGPTTAHVTVVCPPVTETVPWGATAARVAVRDTAGDLLLTYAERPVRCGDRLDLRSYDGAAT